jgi:hypothetical protein
MPRVPPAAWEAASGVPIRYNQYPLVVPYPHKGSLSSARAWRSCWLWVRQGFLQKPLAVNLVQPHYDIVGEFKKAICFELEFVGCQAQTSNSPTISLSSGQALKSRPISFALAGQ